VGLSLASVTGRRRAVHVLFRLDLLMLDDLAEPGGDLSSARVRGVLVVDQCSRHRQGPGSARPAARVFAALRAAPRDCR
jgi:hypothetical protein